MSDKWRILKSNKGAEDMESNFLEKSALKSKVSEKEILKTFIDRINSNEMYIQDIRSCNNQSIDEYEVALDKIVSNTLAIGEDIRTYVSSRYMEIESQEEKIGRLENEIEHLKEKLSEKATIDREELENLAGRMNTFMELVEENVKTIAVSKKIKMNKGHGKPKDTRIPDEEVIGLYERGWSTQRIADYYNEKHGGVIITANGIRSRLITLGVYKGRRSI